MSGDANGWIRLSVGFADHPKILALPAATIVAHIAAMCWSGRAGTDGHLPKAAARLYAKPAQRRKLVEVGLWDALPDGSYSIHDWGEYQPPADPDERAKWLNANRQRRWRARQQEPK